MLFRVAIAAVFIGLQPHAADIETIAARVAKGITPPTTAEELVCDA